MTLTSKDIYQVEHVEERGKGQYPVADQIIATGYEIVCPLCEEIVGHYELPGPDTLLECPLCRSWFLVDSAQAEHALA